MNALGWILLGESLLAAIIVAIVMTVVARRHQNKLLTALGGLLENLRSGEPHRLQQLRQNLEEFYGVPADAASTVSAELAAAEKEFALTLTRILLTDTSALARLHEPLQNLLDQRMKKVAEAMSRATPAPPLLDELDEDDFALPETDTFADSGEPGAHSKIAGLTREDLEAGIWSELQGLAEAVPPKPKKTSAPGAQKKHRAKPAEETGQQG